jgi:hypothetical protein
MVALTALVESVAEVAVTVTVLPVGAVDGAVYVVATALAVCIGLNDPQLLDPQATLHLTPALAASLLTTARNCVLVPAASVVTGDGANPIEMGRLSIAMVRLVTLVGFAVEEA